MQANYFFIDGSALTAQIRALRRDDASFRARKLCPRRMIGHFSRSLIDLGAQEYKRATFYFPTGDETTAEEYLLMPDHRNPGELRDLHFKYCGQKLKRSQELQEFMETVVPPKWRDRFTKSEKGIDIEMCCDALKLASAARLERLFLLTNDDDFVPFCRAIKEFGSNISIIHLSDVVTRNHSLLREVDSYDVIPKQVLQTMFLPLPEPVQAPLLENLEPPTTEEAVGSPEEAKPIASGEPTVEGSHSKTSALKPDVAPSDMVVTPEDQARAEDIPDEKADDNS